jgi:putative peptidoglycan lipid II flippase
MAPNSSQSQAILSEHPTEPISEEKAMTRAAGVVGFWTTLSRILGFLRDMVIALFLGAGPGADAFFVAFRIPNLLRRLFAEGALSAAFIPTYVETLQKHGVDEAGKLARVLMTFASIVLACVAVLGIVLSPWIVRLIAPGFLADIATFELTVSLNRIMFPYIFFISLVALASGILNSMGSFSAPAAAPIVLNLCMIGGVSLFGAASGAGPCYALAWGVTVAGVLQLALQIPFVAKVGIRPGFDFGFGNPALKTIGRLFAPAALGGAVYQINVLVGTILASMLPSGSVSWLYYADRLVELPLGVFAIALGTAVLPSMSRLAGRNDIEGLVKSISYALRLIALFTIPASVGLILLREPIIAILFQRGLFTYADTVQTASALLWYTVGLWAFSGLKVVTQAFFALKDTKTPVWVSVAAVAVNLAAGLALMGPMGQGGLALATSLAAAFNVLVLFVLLARRLGGFPTRELLVALAKQTGASAFMGVGLLYLRGLGAWDLGLTASNLAVLAGAIVIGAALFASAAYVLGCSELRSLVQLVRRMGPKTQFDGS